MAFQNNNSLFCLFLGGSLSLHPSVFHRYPDTDTHTLLHIHTATNTNNEAENQIYQGKFWKGTKYTGPNIPNQIHLINPTKLIPTNQFYQTQSRETKSTEN